MKGLNYMITEVLYSIFILSCRVIFKDYENFFTFSLFMQVINICIYAYCYIYIFLLQRVSTMPDNLAHNYVYM